MPIGMYDNGSFHVPKMHLPGDKQRVARGAQVVLRIHRVPVSTVSKKRRSARRCYRRQSNWIPPIRRISAYVSGIVRISRMRPIPRIPEENRTGHQPAIRDVRAQQTRRRFTTPQRKVPRNLHTLRKIIRRTRAFIVIAGIHLPRQSQLLLVRYASRTPRRIFCRSKNRHQDRSENRDDSDHNQQFYKRKSAFHMSLLSSRENEIGGVAGLSPMLVGFDSEASEAGIRTLTVAAQCRNLTGLSPFELGYDNRVFAIGESLPLSETPTDGCKRVLR